MSINETELKTARDNWGKALVAISTAFDNDGFDAARVLAENALDTAYDYANGAVLFKPTLANGEQTFRTTRRAALSYFISHDDDYPNDNGFALGSWRQVEFETAGCFLDGDVAMWMGWAHFTNKDGEITTAEKSFGFKKDETGTVRIVLHHSSLPYSA